MENNKMKNSDLEKMKFLKFHKQPAVIHSYGIACGRVNDITKRIELIMIKRKTSYSFDDFLHERYDINDEKRILQLLNHMSNDEKLDLLSLDYGRLWYRAYMVNPDSKFTPDDKKLDHARQHKYNVLKKNFEKNFTIKNSSYLRSLINKSYQSECLWELPKGRKVHRNEHPINCAVREFYEETGISCDYYDILDGNNIEIAFISGRIKYVYHYYLAYLIHNVNLKLDFSTNTQISEVSDIKWVNKSKLKNINLTNNNLKLIQDIFSILKNRYNIKNYALLNTLSTEKKSEKDNWRLPNNTKYLYNSFRI